MNATKNYNSCYSTGGETVGRMTRTNLTSNPGFQSTLTLGSKEVINEKAYNPFEHRQVEHPNSLLSRRPRTICQAVGRRFVDNGFYIYAATGLRQRREHEVNSLRSKAKKIEGS
ncbi:hypothetical protein EVAR_54430_1 [Eumeta japonica]|uniref:Uncharacterized protein n=1 Tax=Eumeta variegata TaxID=151549 RepID=A0A4C1YY19_EUMVA|nr:hypothetical protein EVAR_54430_1 [Eumeta japonica]